MGSATVAASVVMDLEQQIVRARDLERAVSACDVVMWQTDETDTITASEGGGLESLGLLPNQAIGSDASLWQNDPYREAKQRIDNGEDNVRYLVKGSAPRWAKTETTAAWESVWIKSYAAVRSASGRRRGIVCVATRLDGAFRPFGQVLTCLNGSCMVSQGTQGAPQ